MFHDSFINVWRDSFICFKTHVYHDAFIYDMTRSDVPWRMCTMTYPYATYLVHMYHDSCASWRIHLWHDSFICTMTHVYHDVFICDMSGVRDVVVRSALHQILCDVPRLISVRHNALNYVWRDLFMYVWCDSHVTWPFIHVCVTWPTCVTFMTRSCMCDVTHVPEKTRLEMHVGMQHEILDGHRRSLFKQLIWKETWNLTIEDFDLHFDEHFESHLLVNGLYVWCDSRVTWPIHPGVTWLIHMWHECAVPQVLCDICSYGLYYWSFTTDLLLMQTCEYRAAKTHRMPYLYRSFSAKEPCT